MLFNIIPLVIIFICIVFIIIMILKKFPSVSNIDISTIQKEKESEIKNKILSERLTRKTAEHIDSLVKFVKPVWQVFQTRFRKMYQKSVDLERKYRRKHQPLLSKSDLRKNVNELLKKAKEFYEKEELASAEKQYIEIISLDNKNYEAYKGLSEVYLRTKEYEQAQEVLEYVVKMKLHEQKYYSDDKEKAAQAADNELAENNIELGLVYKSMGHNEKALEAFIESVELNSHHPRYLDLLLEMAITLNKRQLAVKTFNVLKEVNSDNQKLEEFSVRIKEIEE